MVDKQEQEQLSTDKKHAATKKDREGQWRGSLPWRNDNNRDPENQRAGEANPVTTDQETTAQSRKD